MRRPHVHRPSLHDRGSASVLVVSLVAVVVLVGTVGVALGQVATARHRAAAAADLAALAVAARALDGSQAACARGRVVATAQGADLVACDLEGEVALVVAQVPLRGALAGLGGATGRARSGPAVPGPVRVPVPVPGVPVPGATW